MNLHSYDINKDGTIAHGDEIHGLKPGNMITFECPIVANEVITIGLDTTIHNKNVTRTTCMIRIIHDVYYDSKSNSIIIRLDDSPINKNIKIEYSR